MPQRTHLPPAKLFEGLDVIFNGRFQDYINHLLFPHRFCLCLDPLNVLGEELFPDVLYIISISDIQFFNVFAKELFPDIALQLWERGEQSRLEEVSRKVLVQHVPAAFISGTIGTCKKS